MKNFLKIVGCLIGLAIVAAIVYRAVNVAPEASLPQSVQVSRIFSDAGCLSCHSADPKLPFYATWPIIGKMVQKDAQKGYRYFDMTPVMAALAEEVPVGEVDLQRIAQVVARGTMPPAKYYLVHWGSSLTAKKRDILTSWSAGQLSANYKSASVAAEFANEPVQPIETVEGVDLRKVVLGNLLYHDTRLSLDNSISCASCHDLSTAGVDNDLVSEGVGGALGGVNAPTVFNSVYNFVQFWDGRAASLAEQAAGPPLNPVEMANVSFDQIVEKLAADRAFAAAFVQVYPQGISEETITDAIAEFEKTLTTPDSPFDLYLKGDTTAISAEALRGYNLFKHYDCSTCHTGQLLGGQSYELMGITQDYFGQLDRELTEEDNGRFKQTATERDRHRFKVPGLRNVALTTPYFHDGSESTLRGAIVAMAKYQEGLTLPQDELEAIELFLETLTGKYQGVTLTNTNLATDCPAVSQQ